MGLTFKENGGNWDGESHKRVSVALGGFCFLFPSGGYKDVFFILTNPIMLYVVFGKIFFVI